MCIHLGQSLLTIGAARTRTLSYDGMSPQSTRTESDQHKKVRKHKKSFQPLDNSSLGQDAAGGWHIAQCQFSRPVNPIKDIRIRSFALQMSAIHHTSLRVG